MQPLGIQCPHCHATAWGWVADNFASHATRRKRCSCPRMHNAKGGRLCSALARCRKHKHACTSALFGGRPFSCHYCTHWQLLCSGHRKYKWHCLVTSRAVFTTATGQTARTKTGWRRIRGPPLPPGGSLGYCTCAPEAISTKRRKKMAHQWPTRLSVRLCHKERNAKMTCGSDTNKEAAALQRDATCSPRQEGTPGVQCHRVHTRGDIKGNAEDPPPAHPSPMFKFDMPLES